MIRRSGGDTRMRLQGAIGRAFLRPKISEFTRNVAVSDCLWECVRPILRRLWWWSWWWSWWWWWWWWGDGTGARGARGQPGRRMRGRFAKWAFWARGVRRWVGAMQVRHARNGGWGMGDPVKGSVLFRSARTAIIANLSPRLAPAGPGSARLPLPPLATLRLHSTPLDSTRQLTLTPCAPLTAHRSLLTHHRSPLTAHRSPPTAHRSPRWPGRARSRPVWRIVDRPSGPWPRLSPGLPPASRGLGL
jgi:hypothetical protein